MKTSVTPGFRALRQSAISVVRQLSIAIAGAKAISEKQPGRSRHNTHFEDFNMWQALAMGLIPRFSRKVAGHHRQAGKIAAFCLVAASVAVLAAPRPASATETIRIAAQKTGTLDWELQIIKAHGLAKRLWDHWNDSKTELWKI